MAAIVTHGALAGPWGWIVGIVGALVSAAAKGVWAIGMHTIRIKLDRKYEVYLRTLQQQAGTEQALALAERDRLLTKDRTVKLRLALEARHGGEATVDQVTNRPQPTPVQSVEPAADQPVEQIETSPEPVPVHTVQAAVNRPVQPKDQVAELHQRLKRGDHITKARAAEIRGVSESTAYRRLTEDKAILNTYN